MVIPGKCHCGNISFVLRWEPGRLYAVVSVHAFEGVDPSLLRPVPASFEGERETDRLARRARNWIADVEFAVAGAGGPLHA